ncbi:TPA: hypothetical protein K8M96_001062 [Clostridium perfringens]|nr:hypothetical protein [Clostridium perfringens]HBI6968772.1 hypothetical protein [Clostridium perfringens]HBI6971814.1 hypothetical protein [Clostridium perfringens]HBI6987151.1 hypothetical protein [Clostridium perfringens]HBI7003990.1 hypothetical protein [Clostridium perfringens]
MGFSSKVKDGYVDLFYAFKLKDKKLYKSINEDIVKLNCVVSDINGKEIFLKQDYKNYFKCCLYKANEKFQSEKNCIELDEKK